MITPPLTPETLTELRQAVAKYDENDSETAYYDAKEVCNAARAYLWALESAPAVAPPMTPETLTRLIARMQQRMQHDVFCPARPKRKPQECSCVVAADLALLRGIGAQVAQLEADRDAAKKRMWDIGHQADALEASLAAITAERADHARLIVQANERTSQAEALAMDLQGQLASLTAERDRQAHEITNLRQALLRQVDRHAALSQGHDTEKITEKANESGV